MIKLERKHKCRSCGRYLQKELQVDGKDPRLSQLAHVWMRTWLKLKDERCGRCFKDGATKEELESFRRFENASKPLDAEGMINGLKFAAEHIEASGIKLDQGGQDVNPNEKRIVVPQELLDFVVEVPRIVAHMGHQLERIADKLDTFKDFSNVFDDESGEAAEPGDLVDIMCPSCGMDDALYEHMTDDGEGHFDFLCWRCRAGFDVDDALQDEDENPPDNQNFEMPDADDFDDGSKTVCPDCGGLCNDEECACDDEECKNGVCEIPKE